MPGVKRRSYVWHYFDILGSTIKCRVCRQEFICKPRDGTSRLIAHLERVHGLRERGIRVKDISSIPTKSLWPNVFGTQMTRRIYENFQQGSDGSWQCKNCSFVCQIRKLRPMFYHLKTVHWLANGPASAEDFVPVNHNGITRNDSEPRSSRRVFEDFEETSSRGTWRCKNCTYTCQKRKLPQMLHHLRTVHGKANGPTSADEFVAGNQGGLTDNCTETLNAGKQETKNDAKSRSLITNSNNVSNKIGEDEPRTFHDLHNESETSSNSSSVIVDEESTMINAHYKIRISLPDGSEVEGLVVGGEDDLNDAEKEKRTVNLDRDNVHAKSRIVSKEKDYSSNLQRDVDQGMNQEFENDDVTDLLMDPGADERRKKSDHWCSTKFGRKLDDTSLRQAKIPKSAIAVQMERCTRKHDGRMKSKELGPPKLEIQVPFQNVQRLTTDINCNGNESRASINPYKYMETEKTGKKHNVAVITFNRPKAHRFSKRLVNELNDAVNKFDNDGSIGAIIITGIETVFAVDFADTDINQMQNQMSAQKIEENNTIKWNCISNTSKPVIAAVNGYILGGGCELAMMCDIIYAGDNARFSQPEVVVGTIPGPCDTQRLTRATGKSNAMKMVRTGNPISAIEAKKSGLVSKIFAPDQLLAEAIKLGERISAHSQLIVSMTKETVNSAYETMIKEGLVPFKKKLFCGTIITEAGVTCTFGIEKRPPELQEE